MNWRMIGTLINTLLKWLISYRNRNRSIQINSAVRKKWRHCWFSGAECEIQFFMLIIKTKKHFKLNVWVKSSKELSIDWLDEWLLISREKSGSNKEKWNQIRDLQRSQDSAADREHFQVKTEKKLKKIIKVNFQEVWNSPSSSACWSCNMIQKLQQLIKTWSPTNCSRTGTVRTRTDPQTVWTSRSPPQTCREPGPAPTDTG